LAEKSSEIPYHGAHTWAWRAGKLMQVIGPLVKFHPANTVRAALLKEGAEFPLIAGWALSRLVAWALFDQCESKRIPKPKRKTRAAKRPFKPTYAYKAGQLYLLYHVDHFFREDDGTALFRKITTEEVALAMTMYFGTGQIRKNFGHRGRTLSNLHNDKKRRRDLMFVYHVMDFLVRASLSGREDDVCKVKIARYFAEKIEPMGEQLSASKVEKVWNQYRAAAPYIYAFYPRLYRADGQQGACAKAKKITEEEWIGRIAQLATKSTLEDCLGHAAFAADVLAKTDTHDVRTQDFKEVSRKAPLLREFSAIEQTIIGSYDDKAPIK
jgi:hypothetical protein